MSRRHWRSKKNWIARSTSIAPDKFSGCLRQGLRLAGYEPRFPLHPRGEVVALFERGEKGKVVEPANLAKGLVVGVGSGAKKAMSSQLQ